MNSLGIPFTSCCADNNKSHKCFVKEAAFLSKNGVNNEYNKLLEKQNVQLETQKQKLKELKALQAQINDYKNQEAKAKNYDNYSNLKKT